MQERLTIRGLPRSIARDGWWLDAPSDPFAAPDGIDTIRRGKASRMLRTIAGIVVLVGVADLLFWHHDPGLSVAVFAIAIFAVATSDIRPRRSLIRPLLLLLAGALPIVDYVQVVSLTFLGAAIIAALIWARHPQADISSLGRTTLTFLGRLPARWATQLIPRRARLPVIGVRTRKGGIRALPGLSRLLRDWAFPAGGTLILTALLMDANPVFARIFTLDFDVRATFERALFWAGVALLVTPLLSPKIPLDDGPRPPPRLGLPKLGINAGSVLRALVVFNLLVGLQMGADISILIGGAALPPGMSYADYAHRGAYPLLATAILAGSFALAVRPYLSEHRLIRPLMLLWLGQNVVLCGAAALRLDLYISAYGLTYLRLYALIWIGLVAAGLALCLWQVLRRRDNLWVVLRTAVLGLTTLYLCGFVNFAQVIAAQNLAGERPDRSYLCSLGPLAAGPIVANGVGRIDLDGGLDVGSCRMERPKLGHWQEWGFRNWQARRYLAHLGPSERFE